MPGEDSAIIRISKDTCLVQTLDFFTPIVDEPITQGEITACNVTNDIYAKGATNILGVLVIMGFPPELPTEISVDLLKGFSDFCRKLGTQVVGGHTITNPWPILGGTAAGMMKINDVVYKKGAKSGDNLILTKPLGVQPVMAAYRLLKEEETLSRELLSEIPRKTVEVAIKKAISSMTTTNKSVAEAMLQTRVNAATDVTGFGLVGHALEMAQQSGVDIEISRIPVFKGSIRISDILGYSLRDGRAHETAGGMLLSVSQENTKQLVKALEKRQVTPYMIGGAKKGKGEVKLSKDPQYIEV